MYRGAAVLIGIAAIYVGLYLALVIPKTWCVETIDITQAEYRVGGRYSELLFLPIHRLDRRARPDVWPQTRFDLETKRIVRDREAEEFFSR